MKQSVSIVFHASVLIHHLYILKYSDEVDYSKTTDQRVLEIRQFRYKYATGWNIVMQTVYFGLALLYDLSQFTSGYQFLKSKLLNIKGYIFTTWVFPWTLVIFFLFWSVYSINREWVLPEASDAVFPSWLNHSFHTNIIVFLCIEMCLVKQILPNFKSAFLGLSTLALIYNVIFFQTYFQSGRWIYGVFYILQWHERILFVLFNYFAGVAALGAGMSLMSAKLLKTE